jgi:hypothetical protein
LHLAAHEAVRMEHEMDANAACACEFGQSCSN